MEKPVAIVLGGTVPHIRLVEILKQKGYYVIVIDYYENPPGIGAADEHIRESTLDIDKVYDIVVSRNASLIAGLCVDHANVTACYISEKLGLPTLYSYETSLIVTDKGKMKSRMKECCIPTSDFQIAADVEQIDLESISYPAVVKPVDNNGSKGVQKIYAEEELPHAFGFAKNLSRKGEVIIEGFNEGFEIQVDCFVSEGKADVLMTKKRLKIKSASGEALQSFGSVIPAGLDDEQMAELQSIADKIANGFGLNNTPFFFQAIVCNDGIKVLELSPRIGGTTSFVMIKMVTGFDIMLSAVDALLGNKVDMYHHDPIGFTSTIIIYAHKGIFDRISGYQDLLDDGTVDEFYISMTKDMELGDKMDSRNRVGSFVITAPTKEQLLDKATKALDSIEVYNTDNRPIMRRDLYPTIEQL